MAEKPTIAFVLSLAGAILVLINGLIVAVAASIIGAALSTLLPGAGGLVTLMGIGSIVIGILMLISSIMLYSTNKSRITTGSILVIIFSIISVFIGGGFFIGTILGIIGGVLGLVWKPSEAAPPPPPPSY